MGSVPETPTNQDPDPSRALPGSLGGLTEDLGLGAIDSDHDPLIGMDIGGIAIKRLIAEGGMGRVYEGEQHKPRRPVAVKVMRPGAVSKETCRRFDHESEMLARLRHPCIAQIYSAGICSILGAQIPFFVMEYVADASTITAYARRHKLSTDQRLELFRKVCEAVAHGHAHGVIHRDLKPGNILVDPSGMPKVIDFGVARSVDASTNQRTALTDVGQLIGTVEYMSPEQFTADPTHIDTRADVYALGVILYELLTGQKPYEISRKQIFEAADVIRKQKPVSPSKLNPTVRPDVERITDRCLQKDRTRRYANAMELAADVEICLEPYEWARRKHLAPLDRRGERSSHRGRSLAALAGAAGLLAILTAGWFVSRPPAVSQMTNSLGMSLVRLPQGRFTAQAFDPGMSPGEAGTPALVRITEPFWIGKHEVTQSQWQSLMGTAPWLDKPPVMPAGDAPAVCVSWSDAVVFCRTLTERERARGALRQDQEYRLPTEAEWEYACRAGSTANYCFGDNEALLGEFAWFRANTENIGRPFPQPVGMKKPNAWGLHDMHGNAWEWVLDAYDPTPPRGKNPMRVSSTDQRVLRGGSFLTSPAETRASYRHSGPNQTADNRFRNRGDQGFRVVVGGIITPPPHTPLPEAPTRLIAFRGSRERKLAFDIVGHDQCPVWGNNPYTDDSCLATAAVHAGALKPGERGRVVVTLLPGAASYPASIANGVQTKPWGAWGYSFRIESFPSEPTVVTGRPSPPSSEDAPAGAARPVE